MARVGAELRRRDFVEATVRVIAEHGASGATTRRIAAEAGCPLATLHYVFHTKEDLFYAVYESLLEAAQEITGGAQRTQPLRESAPAQLRQMMQWLAANPALARAQAELFAWALRFNPDLAKRTYELTLDLARRSFRNDTDEGIDERLVEALARLTIALIDGLLTSWFAQEDMRQLAADTEFACRALTLFVDGWAAPAPRRARAAKAAT